jgi:DNA mismatch repair ATPase MutL
MQLDFVSTSSSSPGSQQKKRKTNTNNNENDENDGMSSTQQSKVLFPQRRTLHAKVDWEEMKQKILNQPELPPQGTAVHEDLFSVSGEQVKIVRDDIQHMQIIGRLDRQAGGLFIVKLRGCLFVFDQYKCEEAFAYYQLKSSHEMKREPLQEPIVLTEHNLGGKEQWEIAANEQYHKILLYNGFEVVRQTGSGPSVTLVAVSSEIPNLGLPDLMELLRIIKKVINSNRVKSSSFMVRPPRILQYFAEESTRLAQKLSPVLTPDEAKQQLNKLASSPQFFEQCPHKQPIFTRL